MTAAELKRQAVAARPGLPWGEAESYNGEASITAGDCDREPYYHVVVERGRGKGRVRVHWSSGPGARDDRLLAHDHGDTVTEALDRLEAQLQRVGRALLVAADVLRQGAASADGELARELRETAQRQAGASPPPSP